MIFLTLCQLTDSHPHLKLDIGSNKARASNWALTHSTAEIQPALTSVRLRGSTFPVQALRVVKFLTVYSTLATTQSILHFVQHCA